MKLTLAITLSVIAFVCGCDAGDQAKTALNAARSLAAEGRYDDALAKHVWFHDHALAVDPSYYGVRLSFALSDWIELGKKYPPALAKLREIRDDKSARLSAGENNRAIFHDVVSINEHLAEPGSTVRLFAELETARPDFAAVIADLAEDAVVSSQRYDLAAKYLGDPVARLDHAEEEYKDGMRYAETSRHRDAARNAMRGIFTEKAVRIITVLKNTGRQEQARQIQAKALGIVDDSAIRNAIKP